MLGLMASEDGWSQQQGAKFVSPPDPGVSTAKMSNEPPPPYPGGPTAPLLEEKSGAPHTPGKDVKLTLVEVCMRSINGTAGPVPCHWPLRVFPDLCFLGSCHSSQF